MAQYLNSSNNINLNSKITQTAVSYAALLSDNIIEVTSTAVARTITLPAPSTVGAAANVGKIYIIKDTSGAAATNNITIAPVSGTIDAVASVVINTNLGFMAVFCDGTSWFVKVNSALPNSPVKQISASTYTAALADSIIESNFAGSVIVTLPAPASTPVGHLFTVKDSSGLAGTNNITVKSAAGNIDGTAGTTGQIIASNYGVMQVYNDGTNYYTIVAPSNSVTPSVNIQTFVASGTYTPSVNCQYIIAECSGGGGAGGGSNNSPGTQSSASGGGGAGGYVRGKFALASVSPSVAVTIGAGGVGVSASTGGTGGTTTFSTLTANGGTGGNPAASQLPSLGKGGLGGTATGGSLQVTGYPGDFGVCVLNGGFGSSGNGGSNPLGSGGAGVFGASSTAGNAGTGMGGGGSGAMSSSGGGPNVGGNGAAGGVVVTEYIFSPPAIVTNSSITWTTLSGVSQAMVAGTGYYCTNGAAISLSLPTTAAAGTVIAVVNVAAGLWTITQAAGQSILMGAQQTTIGVGGSLVATATGNEAYLLCISPNTTWSLIGGVGNLVVN